jgi:predicted Na+-dependent transporter
MKVQPDWFLIGMVLATLLAWAFPRPGSEGGWMHPAIATKAGVALIFFLHGLALSLQALRAGVLNWRLHLVVQSFTFLVFPLLGIMINALLGDAVAPELALGLFFLCALPSTVSSSVAMTAAADKRMPSSISGSAIGSCTLRSTLDSVMPMPRAASTVAGSTWRACRSCARRIVVSTCTGHTSAGKIQALEWMAGVRARG